MLTLTPDAAQAVDTIVSRPDLPDDAGLRITAEPQVAESGPPTTDLRLEMVDAPEPDDEVIEGSQLYIEQGTAELLGDKVLDAEFAEDQVQFKLRDQD
jgi:Fe-S cluster assembly iron-binding protein IscA